MRRWLFPRPPQVRAVKECGVVKQHGAHRVTRRRRPLVKDADLGLPQPRPTEPMSPHTPAGYDDWLMRMYPGLTLRAWDGNRQWLEGTR